MLDPAFEAALADLDKVSFVDGWRERLRTWILEATGVEKLLSEVLLTQANLKALAETVDEFIKQTVEVHNQSGAEAGKLEARVLRLEHRLGVWRS